MSHHPVGQRVLVRHDLEADVTTASSEDIIDASKTKLKKATLVVIIVSALAAALVVVMVRNNHVVHHHALDQVVSLNLENISLAYAVNHTQEASRFIKYVGGACAGYKKDNYAAGNLKSIGDCQTACLMDSMCTGFSVTSPSWVAKHPDDTRCQLCATPQSAKITDANWVVYFKEGLARTTSATTSIVTTWKPPGSVASGTSAKAQRGPIGYTTFKAAPPPAYKTWSTTMATLKSPTPVPSKRSIKALATTSSATTVIVTTSKPPGSSTPGTSAQVQRAHTGALHKAHLVTATEDPHKQVSTNRENKPTMIEYFMTSLPDTGPVGVPVAAGALGVVCVPTGFFYCWALAGCHFIFGPRYQVFLGLISWTLGVIGFASVVCRHPSVQKHFVANVSTYLALGYNTFFFAILVVISDMIQIGSMLWEIFNPCLLITHGDGRKYRVCGGVAGYGLINSVLWLLGSVWLLGVLFEPLCVQDAYGQQPTECNSEKHAFYTTWFFYTSALGLFGNLVAVVYYCEVVFSHDDSPEHDDWRMRLNNDFFFQQSIGIAFLATPLEILQIVLAFVWLNVFDPKIKAGTADATCEIVSFLLEVACIWLLLCISAVRFFLADMLNFSIAPVLAFVIVPYIAFACYVVFAAIGTIFI